MEKPGSMAGLKGLEMGVYDPLRDHLRHQRLETIEITFDEIEKLTGRTLPASAYRPQYWENAASPSNETPARKACREGGYQSFLIRDARKVRLTRL